jgi:HK97 family phage major capsid protein
MSEQTKTIKIPDNLTREGVVQMDAEKKTVSISISSDTPYERYDWWNDERYYEVLDHSPAGVSDGRLKSGLPMLFNHDREAHLGRASSYSNDGKRITVSDLAWSESAMAKEKKADMENGVLVDTSVGYRILGDGECVGAKDGIPIYKFKWEPHEFSLVTIPADFSVGVGRARSKPDCEPHEVRVRGALDKANETENKRDTTMSEPAAPVQEPKIDVVKERADGARLERERRNAIEGHRDNFQVASMKEAVAELAKKAIAEGISFDDYERSVIANWRESVKVIQADPSEGMKKRDIEKYSVLRAINSIAGAAHGKRFDGLEREMSDEVAKRHDRPASTLGFYIPHDVMARTLFATGSFSGAGALVPIGAQGQSMIDLYRNKMHVVAMGAQVLSGLQGTLAIPRQTGGATAAWLAEDATITASQQTVGQLTLTPHRLAAATAFSTQLLAQASPDIENFVRNDLMTVLAVEKDRAALLGSGAAGEPRGIYNTSDIASTVDITATASITYAEAVQFETNVAAGNADLGSLGYITSVFIRGTARVTPKFANTGMPLWEGDMLANHKARATNQLTATPSVIFGNWSDLIIGDWVSPEIIVDPYSLSMANQIRVVVHQLTDVGIRHLKSFCFGVV